MFPSELRKYSNDELSRWIWLRAEEWVSYPTFLAPIWGIIFVYFYGWTNFIITLIVVTFIWKTFIMKSIMSINILFTMALIINFLKWPLAVVFAYVGFLTHHSLLFNASMLLFPAISYVLLFLEVPYKMGGIVKQGKLQQEMQDGIMNKLGVKVSLSKDMPKGKYPFLF